MEKYWLWLSLTKGISLRQKNKLLKHFSNPEEIYRAADETIFQKLELEPVTLERDLRSIEKLQISCQGKGIDIMPIGDPRYPQRLRELPDAPIVLYYKGIWPDFAARPMFGIVGTRKATSYGKNCARMLSQEISACGGIVVSGGAEGVDTHALLSALDAGAMPIAVFGCGLDISYPPVNRRLFGRIAQSGCLISEYPPGTKPSPWQFPARNRIISGVSNAIVVIEAPEKSGALITAQRALEQGRDVFVAPGNIDVLTNMGSNRLLREGASPILTGWDAVSIYQDAYPQVAKVEIIPEGNPDQKEKCDKKVIDNSPPKPYHFLNDGACSLTEEECRLLSYLSREPKEMDEVIAKMGLPSSVVLGMLTDLSLRGIVINHSGRRVSVK